MQNISVIEQEIIKNGISESVYPYNLVNNMIGRISFDTGDTNQMRLNNRLLRVLSCIEFAHESNLGATKKEQIKLSFGVVAMSIAFDIMCYQMEKCKKS